METSRSSVETLRTALEMSRTALGILRSPLEMPRMTKETARSVLETKTVSLEIARLLAENLFRVKTAQFDVNSVRLNKYEDNHNLVFFDAYDDGNFFFASSAN